MTVLASSIRKWGKARMGVRGRGVNTVTDKVKISKTQDYKSKSIIWEGCIFRLISTLWHQGLDT